jgi:Ku protein
MSFPATKATGRFAGNDARQAVKMTARDKAGCRNQPLPIVLNPSRPRNGVLRMAPRANWKGFLRLPLSSVRSRCTPPPPIPKSSASIRSTETLATRIKYSRVDAETGEEVASEDIVKAFKIDTDTYVEVSKEELENVALESTRTIEIDEFVARDEINPRYIIRPYYLRPDGKVGHDAFAAIRETIREMDKVAIGWVVLTSREHIIALEPLDKGLMGTLLRYPYEVIPASDSRALPVERLVFRGIDIAGVELLHMRQQRLGEIAPFDLIIA